MAQLELLAEPEVRDHGPHLTLLARHGDEDVVGFDVPVADVQGVEVGHPLSRLPEDGQSVQGGSCGVGLELKAI